VKRVLISSAAALALAGCPGPDKNPPTLWLAPNGSEVVIQLVDHTPPPW
jgi:hypothetical protein